MSLVESRDYSATTDRILQIDWSELGDYESRRQSWGGIVSSWGVEKLASDVYRIPRSVPVEHIDESLDRVLLPSDSAVLCYPYGTVPGRDASALRVRTYNVHNVD